MRSCQDCGFNNSLLQGVDDHSCSVAKLCFEIEVSHEIDRRSNFENEVMDGHSRKIENVEVFLWHAVVGNPSLLECRVRAEICSWFSRQLFHDSSVDSIDIDIERRKNYSFAEVLPYMSLVMQVKLLYFWIDVVDEIID
jgi:hypothetical protein